MSPPAITIEEQIACVERELRFRRRVYPRWVKDGKLTDQAASLEVLRMVEVLETLARVRDDIPHVVPNVDDVRAGERARILGILSGLVPSSVMVQVHAKLVAAGVRG